MILLMGSPAEGKRHSTFDTSTTHFLPPMSPKFDALPIGCVVGVKVAAFELLNCQILGTVIGLCYYLA
jgi:hypothetical protein